VALSFFWASLKTLLSFSLFFFEKRKEKKKVTKKKRKEKTLTSLKHYSFKMP